MSERNTGLLLAVMLYGGGLLAGGLVFGIPEGDGIFASAFVWAPSSALLPVVSSALGLRAIDLPVLGYLRGFLIILGVPAYWAAVGTCVATGRHRLARALLLVHYATAPVLFALLFRAEEPRYRDRFMTTAGNDIEMVVAIVAWYVAGQILLWWWMRTFQSSEDEPSAAVG